MLNSKILHNVLSRPVDYPYLPHFDTHAKKWVTSNMEEMVFIGCIVNYSLLDVNPFTVDLPSETS